MTRSTKASLLLFFFSLCGVAFVITQMVRDHVRAPDPRELFAVVNEQLIALRADDFPDAYRCASTGVQQKFTLTQFEAMIRQNYAEMTNAQRVEFGYVKVDGGTALVQAFFFTADGRVRTFLYSLLAESDGWKIGGVEELRRPRSQQRLSGTYV
ncbi:MAG: DUF4864 domain-containing protein [Chthoniobacterales bacterium]